MVTFVCSNCGTSLKKNQVEKHTFQCRTSSFSCIDCNKDFHGNDYVAHTKCISEIERYSAKGWKPPANHNKGEKKQDEWVNIVQATLEKHANSISPSSRNLLHTISKHDNVPRKKPKFINFIKNVSRNGFNEATINEVWGILETEWKNAKQPPAPAAEEPPAEAEKSEQPESDLGEGKKKKKKKNKKSEPEPTLEPETMTPEATQTEEDGVQTKKKKKNKSEAEPDFEPETLTPDATEAVEDGVQKKKKKKKNKSLVLECETMEEAAITTNGTEEAQENGVSKKKKRKNQVEAEIADVLDTGVQNGHSVEDVEVPNSLKKKKRKTSAVVQE